MSEFNLSDKIILDEGPNTEIIISGDLLLAKDVKEFIKRLKEECDEEELYYKERWASLPKQHPLFPYRNISSKNKTLIKNFHQLFNHRFKLRIDKLAGDDLI